MTATTGASQPTSDGDDGFQAEVFHNPHLAPDQRRVDAIVAITAPAALAAGGSDARVVGFILDCSGSMQGAPFAAVRQAVEAAVVGLAPSTTVFVVGFNGAAEILTPAAPASDEHKRRIISAVHQTAPQGGTAFSTGLELARDLFAAFPAANRQAIFLTDGRNESERPEALTAALATCQGAFQCTCWGIGDAWEPTEVMRVAAALLGTAALIRTPQEVAAAFQQTMATIADRQLAEVRLRVWTPQGSQAGLKRVFPKLDDLAPHARAVGTQIVEYPTGAWAAGETQEFQLSVTLPGGTIGDQVRAGRLSLAYRRGGQEVEEVVPGGSIVVSWTADETLSSRIPPRLAHYTGQEELAAAIQEGLAAREQGDAATATRLLGRAVQIAHAADNAEMTTRLRRIVDIDDAASGTVRLKRQASRAEAMDLQLESTTTRRARRTAE